MPEHFLQNIVTSDLDALGSAEARPCALLTPQGKILFDFLISRQGEQTLYLECRADIADDLVRRLMLYRLRAKVEISKRDQVDVAVSWGSDSNPSQTESSGVRDMRFQPPVVVRRFYEPRKPTADVQDWTAFRIENGIAESGSDYALGDAFPHDVLLDELGGVGFRKGCYVGQEVVSRMQHRGTARRRVLIVIGRPGPAPGRHRHHGGRAHDRYAWVDCRQSRPCHHPHRPRQGSNGRRRPDHRRGCHGYSANPGIRKIHLSGERPRAKADAGQGRRSAARLAAHAVGPAARPARSLAARRRDRGHRPRAGARGALERPDRRRPCLLGGAAFAAGRGHFRCPGGGCVARCAADGAAARCARICDRRHDLALQVGGRRRLQGGGEAAAAGHPPALFAGRRHQRSAAQKNQASRPDCRLFRGDGACRIFGLPRRPSSSVDRAASPPTVSISPASRRKLPKETFWSAFPRSRNCGSRQGFKDPRSG